MAALEEALERAAGGIGSMLLIEGPAGIGKTRVLAAGRDSALALGFAVRTARGGPLEREMPFGVARVLLEPLLGRANATQRKRWLAGSAHLALPALGLAGSDRASQPDALAAIHGLYWLVANLAEDAPLVLLLDDLQWCDGETLRWLDYMTRRLDDIAVLVIATVRTGEPDEPAGIAPMRLAARMLHPQPLSASGIERLIASETSAPSRAFADACSKATGGNPFLLVELLRALRGDAADPDEASADLVEGLGPGRIADYVLLRLGRFEHEGIAVARAVSVLGVAPQLRQVAALADLDEPSASRVCDRLREAEILAHGLPIQFVHPLVQAAVYKEQPEGERLSAHRRAAEILAEGRSDSADVAAHLLVIPPSGDAWVVDGLRAAASDAASKGAYDSAVRYLERALAEPPEDDRVIRLQLGRALLETDPDRAPAVLDSVVDDLEPKLRREALREAAFAHFQQPDFQGAADRYALLAEELPEDAEATRLSLEAQIFAVRTIGVGPQMEAAARMAGVLEAGCPDLGSECAVRQALALHRFFACQRVDEVVALAASFPPPPSDMEFRHWGLVPGIVVGMLPPCGQWDMAREVLRFIVELSRERGELGVAAMGASLLGLTERHAGRLSDSEAEASVGADWVQERFGAWRSSSAADEDTAQVYTRSPPSLAGRYAVPNLLATLLARGDVEAAQRLAEGRDLSGGFAEVPLYPPPLEVRGLLRLAHGNLKQGIEDLLTLGEESETLGFLNPGAAPWRHEAGMALAANGDAAQGEALIAVAEERARRFAAPHLIGIVLRARAMLERKDRQIKTLEQSVAALEAQGPPHELAASLLELGAAMRRDGRRADSREPLRAALELAHRSGADGVARRAKEELAAAGSRPRTPLRTGVDALTPSELRTARLAAGGLSNVEIAQRLFVSRKTVEKHLGNAYTKLEISSRDDLQAALEVPVAGAR